MKSQNRIKAYFCKKNKILYQMRIYKFLLKTSVADFRKNSGPEFRLLGTPTFPLTLWKFFGRKNSNFLLLKSKYTFLTNLFNYNWEISLSITAVNFGKNNSRIKYFREEFENWVSSKSYLNNWMATFQKELKFDVLSTWLILC